MTDIEFQIPEEIKAFQEKKLHEALAYLAGSSPYYQRMFRSYGIDIKKIEHLEDLVGSGNAEGQSDKTSRYLITISAPTRQELEQRLSLVRSTVQADVRTPEGEIVPLIWF